MTLHKNLTGADLHEPKGIETATAGQVYKANGTGSGTWADPLASIVSLNKFVLSGQIPNVSTAGSSFFVAVPGKASLNKVYYVLSGTLTVANDVLTIYKNGVAQTPTITVPFTGSGAGVTGSANISPAIAFNDGDTLELRSGGGSTGAVVLSASLSFTATP